MLVASVCVGLVVVSCSSTPRLSAEKATAKLQTACAAYDTERKAAKQPEAGSDTFEFDTLRLPRITDSDAYELLAKVHAPKENDAALKELQADVLALARNRSDVTTDFSERQMESGAKDLATGAELMTKVDERAAALGLTNCTAATWVGDWYDEANKVQDDLVESTKPTGDFVTDVGALCSRLDDDISSAPFPLGPIETQQWALAVNDGLRLFSRDLDALDIPADKQAGVDKLHGIIDQLSSDLSSVVAKIAGSNQQALDDSTAAAQSGITEFVDQLHTLGATGC
jgi:hypothetical protein